MTTTVCADRDDSSNEDSPFERRLNKHGKTAEFAKGHAKYAI